MDAPRVHGWSGWTLSLYPTAREAGGCFYRPPSDRATGGDPERSKVEAARRARGKVRRYCAANGLNRLGTLTYAGGGCHDPMVLRADLAGFFRSLRIALRGEAFPYVWTSEWHKSGHGLHAHFAVGQFVPRRMIEAAWGRGFVHIKLLGDLPVGSTRMDEARLAARYLSKYVGKDFDGQATPGLHRYEVAQGFQPEVERLYGQSCEQVLTDAAALMGGWPVEVRRSDDVEDYEGPPWVWARWP